MLTILAIGEKIVVARKMKNLSQAQLAGMLAVSAQAVGKWERGESMPDIVTFSRLAEALGVDLNYFSSEGEMPELGAEAQKPSGAAQESLPKRGWNMSRGDWVDADFSGLSGLAEKFSSANIDKCRFVGSELSGLIMKASNIVHSDFTRSDLSKCTFSSANLENDEFVGCDFSNSRFSKTSIENCDFSGANLTDAMFKYSSLQKVKLSQATLFNTEFVMGELTDMILDGEIVNCSFESCDFVRVEFKGAIIRNCFFKNTKLKRAKFTDCRVDRLSYAFMKSCKADLSGVELLPEA